MTLLVSRISGLSGRRLKAEPSPQTLPSCRCGAGRMEKQVDFVRGFEASGSKDAGDAPGTRE